MKNMLVAAVALAAGLSAPANAQDQSADAEEIVTMEPMRSAEGASVVSLADPEIRVRVPENATYVGAVRWPLYGVADAEIHAFVEADEHGLVQRAYLVQFEQYLPDNDYAYNYAESNPETVELNGHTLHVRPGFMRAVNPNSRADSDGAQFRRLVTDAGYRLPTYMATVRFVELFEPTLRKELLILYVENMDPVLTQMGGAMMEGREGVTFAELMPPLIGRAMEAVSLEPID
ncbi:hypothetical protein [Aurantiacibacter sp. D1-12]|uniref:hypothetical protein n=1 Tax=Aurantiacibacter sp. D1-12 TaxID=2993658 RepID=UPI00237C5B26|nr:hypothetical protein [Aurantiacibacter sp. D1-12]MDE1468555.1 hypothetical protein [Aurantiacibacter sp. D1-12]